VTTNMNYLAEVLGRKAEGAGPGGLSLPKGVIKRLLRKKKEVGERWGWWAWSNDHEESPVV